MLIRVLAEAVDPARNLLQLLVANDTGPLRQYVPRRRYRSCFALRAAHDLLRGLAAAHAAGIVNQDVHAGNLLFAGAGPARRGLQAGGRIVHTRHECAHPP